MVVLVSFALCMTAFTCSDAVVTKDLLADEVTPTEVTGDPCNTRLDSVDGRSDRNL